MLLLFGSTGNLSKERLLPAMKYLQIRDVIAVGRREITLEEFEKIVGIHVPGLSYVYHNIGTDSVDDIISACKKRRQDLLIIMVELYNSDVNMMQGVSKDIELIIKASKYNKVRVMLDKPIGHDRKSAEKIIDCFTRLKDINAEVLFIDHYLYKVASYKKVTKDEIRSIEFVATENKDIKGREAFWDNAGGIVADMIQSHVLQSIQYVSGIDLELVNVHKIVCRKVLKIKNAKSPVYIEVELIFKNDLNIILKVGKYQSKKKTYIKINTEKIDLRKEKCTAYQDIIEKAVNGEAVLSISGNSVKKFWNIAEEINKSISKYKNVREIID